MKWFKFFTRKSQDKSQDKSQVKSQAVREVFKITDLTGSGRTPPGSRGVSQYQGSIRRCVALISHSLSSMMASKSLYVCDMDEQPVISRSRNRMLRDLRRTVDSEETTSKDFWAAAFCDLLLTGNALILIQSREPLLFRLADPAQSSTSREPGRPLMYTLKMMDDGTERRVSVRQVLHLRADPTEMRNGVRWGLSPDDVIDQYSDTGLAAERYSYDIVRNGPFALDNKIIHYDGVAPDNLREQALNMAEERQEDGGPAVMSLPIGSAIMDVNASANIHQVISGLADQNVEHVARYYGVPAPLLGLNLTQWGSGIEMLIKAYTASCLEVYLSTTLAQMSLRLLQPSERFDIPGIAKSRIAQENIAELINVTNGDAQRQAILTPKEIRNTILGVPGDAPAAPAATPGDDAPLDIPPEVR